MALSLKQSVITPSNLKGKLKQFYVSGDKALQQTVWKEINLNVTFMLWGIKEKILDNISGEANFAGVFEALASALVGF